MPLVNGATAAGFHIVRLLGSGEIGELYLAEHPRLPRQQMLQMIPADVSVDLDYRERFTEESDLAAALWHPHIVGLTDRGEFEGQLWLSMDYVDGADAAQLLGDSYPDGMPPKMVIEIVSAIADALDYAHDRGVVHRYVNPSNILVSKSQSDRRRIALLGFGIARRLGDTNTLSRAKVIIGIASYSAPEQLMDDVVDGRADQYALAGTAFHLLTGSPPFAHFNPAVLISKHLNGWAPLPSDVRPDLTDFDAIFARALAKDPIDRFRRCRDFAKALEATGGTRSHFRGASAFQQASDLRDAGATALLAVPESDGVAPTEPAAPAPPDAVAQTEPAAPAPHESDDALGPTDVLPDTEVDDVITSAEPAVSGAIDDDTSAASHSRRMLHTTAIAGTIVVVVLAWFLGVRALRSASESNDTPTGVETTSAEPTTPRAPPTPAMATPPPAMATPPPAPPAPTHAIPPAMVTPPAPAATTPPTTRPSPPATTTPPASSPSPRHTAVSPTTGPHSTPPMAGVDTRPAIGMPCGPEQTGATTVSNTGGPVSCVGTPGGSAWEPPGG
ncbi:MAG: serine/threonine protein kinase, bacterial [Mycobacterium sp.]|nr:serine/threonine protein kinase, bacterial [Mycobacterium sp.]